MLLPTCSAAAFECDKQSHPVLIPVSKCSQFTFGLFPRLSAECKSKLMRCVLGSIKGKSPAQHLAAEEAGR